MNESNSMIFRPYLSKLTLCLAFIITVSCTQSLFALAEKPTFENEPDPNKAKTEQGFDDYDNDESPEIEEFSQPIKYVDEVNVNKTPVAKGANTDKKKVFSEEDIINIENYDKHNRQKQYIKALQALKLVDEGLLTEDQIRRLRILEIFKQIKDQEAENIRQFGKDESLGDDVIRTVKRLQREAMFLILEGKNDLARDILIQSLFLDRKNFFSKQLLTQALGLPLGSYKVENIEAKYWQESQIFLYSGYPMKAVDALTVLANFDPLNSLIFERMGSAYYMSGKVNEAVDSWKRALYLDPDNEVLNDFIVAAQDEIENQKKQTKEFLKKKSATQQKRKEGVEYQTLRVVKDSNTAYSYAQEVRKEMKGIDVIVEELDNGKWAVKVPKSKKETK